jgi:hypothetical protein
MPARPIGAEITTLRSGRLPTVHITAHGRHRAVLTLSEKRLCRQRREM